MRLEPFLYHVASGHAFFTGVSLLTAAVAVRTFAAGRRRTGAALVILGLLSVLISATPLPWVAYALWAAVLAAWAFAESRRTPAVAPSRRLVTLRTAAAASCIAAGLWEIPYHVMPSPVPAENSAVGVIGDSVTAGMGEDEAVTWPRLLARRHPLAVHDHSAMGATVASARKQAAMLTSDDRIVVAEIGGNDLLGGTTPADFEAGLDALLREIARPGRRVLLFELPLPPGFNAFGLAQRRIAARHAAILIPKRALMGVFTGRDATLDSIHLSQEGHDRMAEIVAGLLDANAPASPPVRRESR